MRCVIRSMKNSVPLASTAPPPAASNPPASFFTTAARIEAVGAAAVGAALTSRRANSRSRTVLPSGSASMALSNGYLLRRRKVVQSPPSQVEKPLSAFTWTLRN